MYSVWMYDNKQYLLHFKIPKTTLVCIIITSAKIIHLNIHLGYRDEMHHAKNRGNKEIAILSRILAQ